MKQGLFGGTFDPPHLGHFLAANDAFEALDLDRITFIPTGIQPLKAHRPVASGGQRLRMVDLMIAGDPRFSSSRIEIERLGPSYTIETLECLAAESPTVERYLLVGADALATMSDWREPDRITELARVVVLNRGPLAGQSAHSVSSCISTRRVDISSTEVRARVRSGKSLRGFVHPAVAEYIASERLYQ